MSVLDLKFEIESSVINDPLELESYSVGTITGVTKANPAVVTVGAIGSIANNQVVYIQQIAGMTELNGAAYTVKNVSGNTFQLYALDGVTGINSSSYTTYSSGGIVMIAQYCLTIFNEGESDLTDLGIYIRPATNLGSVEYPAAKPPSTDYQDLLTLGTASAAAPSSVRGGLHLLAIPQNSGPSTYSYITRTAGATIANKIDCADIPANDSIEVYLLFENTAGGEGRRYYVELVVE